jgi:hypothetical protein
VRVLGSGTYKAIGVHEYFHAFYMRQKLGHDSNLSQVFKRLEASSSSLLYSISEGRYVDRTGGHPQNGYQELGAAVLVAATLAERDSLTTQLVRNVETRDLPDLLAVVAAIKLDLTLNNPNRLVVSEQAEIFKILQDYTEIIEQLILSGRTNSVTTLTVTKENENDYRTITIATIVAVASILYASYRRSKSVT